MTTCLHDHDECVTEICGHRECNKMDYLGAARLKKAREEILAILEKFNVEIDVEHWDHNQIVLRYIHKATGKYGNQIDLGE